MFHMFTSQLLTYLSVVCAAQLATGGFQIEVFRKKKKKLPAAPGNNTDENHEGEQKQLRCCKALYS